MPRTSEIEKQGLGDEIITARMNGCTYSQIAQDYSLSIDQVQRFLRKQNETQIIPKMSQIKLQIRQEDAISDLAVQMAEYTQHYQDAMNRGDEKAAYAWSRNRLDLLKEMLKCSGVYDKAKKEADRKEDMEIKVRWVDQETLENERALNSLMSIIEDPAIVPQSVKEGISLRLLEIEDEGR